jgi:2-aminoethylphosphonate-pyruvate transaminase
MLQPDLCHRESEFFDLQDEARRRLLATYSLDQARWAAVLMTASGTAAVESMVAAMVPRSGRLLIVENGVYGERIALICAQYAIPHERVAGDWMRAPDHAAVAALLASQRSGSAFTHVAIVHHETTTGRLNDLRVLAGLCREHGAELLVDAVSSFGAEAIDFTDSALCAVAATANKCLHGVPGAAFVIARRRSLQNAASRSYYLDLARLARLQDERNTPFTPAVHAYYALVEALREYEEQGGRAARYARYAALAERVRSGLAELGIDSAIPPDESSVVLRAYSLPARVTYLFRISTMGELAAADIDRLLHSFARSLQ